MSCSTCAPYHRCMSTLVMSFVISVCFEAASGKDCSQFRGWKSPPSKWMEWILALNNQPQWSRKTNLLGLICNPRRSGLGLRFQLHNPINPTFGVDKKLCFVLPIFEGQNLTNLSACSLIAKQNFRAIETVVNSRKVAEYYPMVSTSIKSPLSVSCQTFGISENSFLPHAV